MSAVLSTPKTTSGGEIITHLINATDGAGLHFDGTSGNIDIASPPDLGAFAVYINNGAGYPTTTTAMTVDALSAEIPAGTVLTFREGGEYIVTTTAAAAATSIVSTSGLTGAAVVDNEGAAYGGANKYSFEFIIQADSWDTGQHYVFDFGTGGRLLFYSEASTDFNLALYDTEERNFGVKVLDDLKVHHLVVTIDGTAAILYDNGNQVGTVSISASNGINNCSDAAIGSRFNGSPLFGGTFYRARFWNKTLSQAEITSVYESASLDYADQWGSQTSLVSAWTNNGGPDGYETFTSSGAAISSAINSSGFGICASAITLTAGSKYRINHTFTKNSGTSPTIRVGDAGNLSTTIFNELATSASEFDFTATTSGTWYIGYRVESGIATNFAVAGFSIVKTGAVADYDLSYANPTQSTIVQNRSGSGDGTAAGGVVQITAIEQLNSRSARIGTSAATPADGDLDVSGNVKIGSSLLIRGDNTATDPGMPYIRSNGDYLVINSEPNNGMYIQNDGSGDLSLCDGGGAVTIGSDILLSEATPEIMNTTGDGSDNAQVRLWGGGGIGSSRGAGLQAYGNESGSTGKLYLQAGNVSGGEILLRTGADATRLSIDSAGAVSIPGTVTVDETAISTTNSCKLEVRSSGNSATSAIRATNKDVTAGTNQAASYDFGLSRNSGAFKPQAGKISVGRSDDWTSDDAKIDAYMAFSVYENNALSEKLRIDSAGNSTFSGAVTATTISAASAAGGTLGDFYANGAAAGVRIRTHHASTGSYYDASLNFEAGSSGTSTRDWDLIASNTVFKSQYEGATITELSATGLAVTGAVTTTGDLGVGTTNPDAGTNAPTARSSVGKLNTYTGDTATIAIAGTLDIALTMPKGLMAYIVESNYNTGHMSAGFFRSNNNGANSTFTLFGQSENACTVTYPSVGTLRITNNTGGATTFFYAITVIAG